MTEDDADENERRQAEALARALDAGIAGDELPQDALETAALLRAGSGEAELSAERADAVLQDVFAHAPKVAAARRRGVRRFVPLAAGFAAAAAVLLVWVSVDRGARAPAQPAAVASGAPGSARALPQASTRLLGLQAELIEGGPEARAQFEREMRDYRGELLRALQREYPARLSLYAPRSGAERSER